MDGFNCAIDRDIINGVSLCMADCMASYLGIEETVFRKAQPE